MFDDKYRFEFPEEEYTGYEFHEEPSEKRNMLKQIGVVVGVVFPICYALVLGLTDAHPYMKLNAFLIAVIVALVAVLAINHRVNTGLGGRSVLLSSTFPDTQTRIGELLKINEYHLCSVPEELEDLTPYQDKYAEELAADKEALVQLGHIEAGLLLRDVPSFGGHVVLLSADRYRQLTEYIFTLTKQLLEYQLVPDGETFKQYELDQIRYRLMEKVRLGIK